MTSPYDNPHLAHYTKDAMRTLACGNVVRLAFDPNKRGDEGRMRSRIQNAARQLGRKVKTWKDDATHIAGALDETGQTHDANGVPL